MKKIAIIHYLPLEFYPPVINFLNYISKDKTIHSKVFTTYNNKKREKYLNSDLKTIYRVSLPVSSEFYLIRLYKYMFFNLSVFIKLLFWRPDSIFYYESFSVGPVYLYLKIFKKKTKLIIHNHEYVSKKWYSKGMKLLKIYHRLEQQYLYKKAISISQTNLDRVDLFLKDNPTVTKEQMMILPNYPPKSWFSSKKLNFRKKDKILTVYIGTLSLEFCYIKEYCEWVHSQKGKVLFDIYAYRVENETHLFLENFNSPYVKYFSNGVEYNAMPNLLAKYDVGVILYKALTDNFKYNAPNKIFEYMACDLEVWYSDKMIGINPFNKNTYPRILPVNFTNINTEILLNCSKLIINPFQSYYAEDVYKPFIKNIIL